VSSYRGKRVVVLGGAGFVGSHLCERLLAEGAAAVVAVDNFITGSEANLATLRRDARFDLVRRDICEPVAVAGPIDFVFNLASPASPIDYAVLWLETMMTGSLGTQRGLELAEAKKAVFLQASTSEIYGDPLVHPQPESYSGNVDPTRPRSVYDEAKRYGEAMVSAFRRSRGVSTRIVRIFNTYGPRMRLDDGRVVPAFMGQALRGEPLTIFGDGSQTRSFCYVDDLVEGLVRLAASNVMDPVNLGNPDERTMIEFAEAVRVATGTRGALVFKPLPEGDPKQRRPDITRAQQLLGWAPQVVLADGLTRTVGFFRESLAATSRAPHPG
jgi:dTDP-glucose 4,6-dehydratase